MPCNFQITLHHLRRRGGRGKQHMSDLEHEGLPVDNGSFFAPRVLLDQEQWYDAWTEELVTTYHTLIDQCQANGLPFLETCTFADFLDFAFRHSSKRPPLF